VQHSATGAFRHKNPGHLHMHAAPQA
jgi:hypothetical protein